MTNQLRKGSLREMLCVCRFIVIKSLPGWIEEICTEHLQSVQPVSAHTKEPGDRAFLAGVP